MSFLWHSAPAKRRGLSSTGCIPRSWGRLNAPDVRERLQTLGAILSANPEQYTAFMQSEIAEVGQGDQGGGIKGE